MIFSIHANAQKNKEWIAVKKEKINFKERYSDFSKNATQFFYLNENLFQKKLAFCSRGQKLKLFLPNGLGGFEWFQIFQYQSLADGLLKKYPSIQSYIGKSDDGHHKTIYFDFSPRGFHGMILTPGKSTTFIDPIGKDHEYYYAYQREISNKKRFFRCLTDNSLSMNNMDSRQANACKNNANQIKSLRLALACTGEYGNYFLTGNEVSIQQKKAIVLSAMNTLIVRINAIFERDLGIHLNLTEGNDNLIFLNELNDPWNHEYNATTQTTIDSIIGIDSYDFGHLLQKENNILNNNGNAGCIGCVCISGLKASAFSSHAFPDSDPFILDYIIHEMGHQLGAHHTFTFSDEFENNAQCEPGSGSTLMGYAGVTGSFDVQDHSDDYFHANSITEISNFLNNGTGNSCGQLVPTDNHSPTLDGVRDYIIPRSTPFMLTAEGMDDDDDLLTYTWEQIDVGNSNNTIPDELNIEGPLFRSKNNGVNIFRMFPSLHSILDGTNQNEWERLPAVARNMNFKLTARDNHLGGGKTQFMDCTISVSNSSGPFEVTTPNNQLTWVGGMPQNFKWNVSNTNNLPVACLNVRILLSVDGGLTFPYEITGSTPNDGMELLTLPDVETNTARIKIESVDNIFFDISNADFTIISGPKCYPPSGLVAHSITNNSAMLKWSFLNAANNYDIDYKVVTASQWTIAAHGINLLNVNITGLLPNTIYDWRIKSNCNWGDSQYGYASFKTTANCGCK